MSYLTRILVDCFNICLNGCLAVVSRGIHSEVTLRDAERGRHTFRWFTPEEAVVAEALANIIVPSDEETPGIDDVCVLGPAAIVALDGLVGESSYRQPVYSRGLLAFDIWARKEHGCNFAEMQERDQIMLFRTAQRIYEGPTASVSAISKLWRKLQAIKQARNGSFFAATLYPLIRGDCLQVFYTSRVSWIWLDYDGPPMDEGYPKLAARR
ncbi:MAG: gluconate 2-dehydrogenase subunit 3 family protein [Terriglobales bacterium]